MSYYALKIGLSAALIVVISEVAKRNAAAAALIASLPVVSLLSFVWMHAESVGEAQIANVAANVFWLALPSLVFFLVLPFLLRSEWGFWTSLAASTIVTIVCYVIGAAAASKLGLLR